MYSHESIASALSEIGSCDGRGLLELGIYNEVQLLKAAVPELLEQIDRLTAGIAAYRKQRNSKDPGEDFAHTWESAAPGTRAPRHRSRRRAECRACCAAIDPNQGEEFRVGLPAEALRKAWPDWEQDITQWPYRILHIRFTSDAGRWSCPGLATWADGHTEPLEHHGKWPGMRPLGASWMEVELKAAALLGAADRKAKRERRSDWELANALGNPKPGAAKGREYENAYRTAYEDAGNSSAKKGDR